MRHTVLFTVALIGCTPTSEALSVAGSDTTVGLQRSSALGAAPRHHRTKPRRDLGIGRFSGDQGALVLQHTDIDAQVSAGLALVQVHQQFWNPFDVPIDATYVLPLPPDAAVRGFELRCGERVIAGEIMGRVQARNVYENARRQGRKAALLEQMRENLFQQQVAGICPGEAVEVTVEYVEQVHRDSGRSTLAFPTTVGERYEPPSDLKVPTHVRPTAAARQVNVSVSIEEGMAVQSLWSDSHEIDVWEERDSGVVVSNAASDTIPNKDFVVTWTLAGHQPAAAVLVHPPMGDDDGYLSLTLEPQLLVDLERQRKRELLFVMDSSCSMRGTPWTTSVAAVDGALDGMATDDTFNLVRFSSTASSLFDRPQPATDDNLARAKQWMGRFEGGGSRMSAGILHSLHMPGDPEALRLVLMLTDGYIGDDRAIVDVVDANLGDARIFSLGVGSSVNRLLLENLADVGRGGVAYQLPDTPVEDTVSEFYERIAHPAMTDIEVDFGDLQVTDMYPSRIPDLWSGQALSIVARYRGDGPQTVRIDGLVGGEEYSISRPVLDEEENEAVRSLWARRRIADIQHDLDLSAREREQQITPVALEYHLVSDWTSLVATETERSSCVGPAAQIEVAHYVPQGTRPTAPATAYAPTRRPHAMPAPAPAPIPRQASYAMPEAPEVRPMPKPMPRPSPQPTSVVTPEPASAPAPARTARFLTPGITGTLSPQVASRALARTLSSVKPCLAGATGTAHVTLTLGPDGTVTSVLITGERLSSDAKRCLTKALKAVVFPTGASQIEVDLRF